MRPSSPRLRPQPGLLIGAALAALALGCASTGSSETAGAETAGAEQPATASADVPATDAHANANACPPATAELSTLVVRLDEGFDEAHTGYTPSVHALVAAGLPGGCAVLEIGDGHGHVETHLQHELRLLAEPRRGGYALDARIEVHEDGTAQEHHASDFEFVRWLCGFPHVRGLPQRIRLRQPTGQIRGRWRAAHGRSVVCEGRRADTPTMQCVVCGERVREGRQHYANAWEAALDQRACCSRECADAFDQDLHWMPSQAPTPLDEDETARLLDRAKRRLRQGDSPAVLARELLLAGMEPWIIRNALHGAGMAAAANQRTARTLSLMTWLGGIRWLSRDKRDPRAIPNAQADIQAWEARFGD